MSDQNRDYLSNTNINLNVTPLPNATSTLVLGILSIVVCFICGIVALAISSKDLAMYRNNPELYSPASYSNIKTGRICAIIGIALQGIGLIVYIILIAFVVSNAATFRH
jgi:hypothetical protein